MKKREGQENAGQVLEEIDTVLEETGQVQEDPLEETVEVLEEVIEMTDIKEEVPEAQGLEAQEVEVLQDATITGLIVKICPVKVILDKALIELV